MTSAHLWVFGVLMCCATSYGCETPDCGDFIEGLFRVNGTCSVEKRLTNGYVEFQKPVAMCSDVNAKGAPVDGIPLTARDKGLAIGSDSGVFYTSGTGQFVHRLSNVALGITPSPSKVCRLPVDYTRIIGMVQLVHTEPLYIATTTALYKSPPTSDPNSTEPVQVATMVADLTQLNLSTQTMFTGLGTNHSLMLVDGIVLHTVHLNFPSPSPSPSSAVSASFSSSSSFLPVSGITTTLLSSAPTTDMLFAEGVDDWGLVVAAFRPNVLVTIEPSTGKVSAPWKWTEEAPAALSPIFSRGFIGTFFLVGFDTTSKTDSRIYQAVLSQEFSSIEVDGGQDFSIDGLVGELQYFLHPCDSDDCHKQ